MFIVYPGGVGGKQTRLSVHSISRVEDGKQMRVSGHSISRVEDGKQFKVYEENMVVHSVYFKHTINNRS